jgi:hypothetical protein
MTPGPDDVLLAWLPEDCAADAALVADLLRIPEAEAARLLAKLEASGDLVSATGRCSKRVPRAAAGRRSRIT